MIGSLIIGFLALINVFMLFATILGDPGVHPSIYKRYSNFYNKQKGEYQILEDTNDKDLENFNQET